MNKIPSMRPEPDRDRYGRYLVNGKAWTRATTVGGTLKDLNGLMDWKRRKVAEGLAINRNLLVAIPDMAGAIVEADLAGNWQAAKEAKAALNTLCDQAADAAGANRGSTAGTQAHTLTEYADAGRLDEVRHLATPDELADLQAYLDAMDAAGIVRPAQYIERIIVNSKVDAAGTLDRIVIMPTPCLGCGRSMRIADVKSQQSVEFGFLEMACQLAIYAYADGMVEDDRHHLEPMPEDLCRCYGLVMHVPVGAATCTLYEVDLNAGWDAAMLAHRLRAMRKGSKTLGVPYLPRVTPAPAAGSQALYLIRDAKHPESLRALWRDLAARGQLTDDLRAAMTHRSAELSTRSA